MGRRIKVAKDAKRVMEEMEEAKAPSEKSPPKQTKVDHAWGMHRDAEDDLANLQLVPWSEEVRMPVLSPWRFD